MMGNDEWDEPIPGSARDRLTNWNRHIRAEQRRNSPQAMHERSKAHLADIGKPPKAPEVQPVRAGVSTAWWYLAICVMFDVANACAWALTQVDLGSSGKATAVCIAFVIGGSALCYLAHAYKAVLLAAWLVQIGVFVILVSYALHLSN